jgi:Ca2+:H+ antiporter
MVVRVLRVSLVLTPLLFVAHWVFHAGATASFALAALALVPLAWLIGVATEHAAEHTGPGVGGFLNATFGNAPELIIALFAVSDGLGEVVRGSLTGSVVGNLLLVFGAALLTQREAGFDRRSLAAQLGIVGVAVVLFLIPSIPGFHGNPDRSELTYLTIPIAVVLLGIYVLATWRSLRRHRRLHRESGPKQHAGGWGLAPALAVLTVATVATALVSEILVHSLDGFAESVGVSQFFLATVIVAIVGNAAEHGSAVVIAHRGKLPLASEIAVSSGAQVSVFVAPLVALLSFLVTPAVSLAFRPVELAAMAGAVVATAIVVADGRGKRREGTFLLAVYAGLVVAFWFAGDRAMS